MPEMMYRHRELEAAIRLAWLTGVRDSIVAGQGRTLDEAQAERLAKFAIEPDHLRATVLAVIRELKNV